MYYNRRLARKGGCGFSLLEQLIVLLILGIVVSAAIPGFAHLRKDWQITTATNEWMAILQKAKFESIASGQRVILCTTDGTLACSNSGLWSDGYLMYLDLNINRQLDVTDTVVVLNSGTPSRVVVRGNGPVARYVQFHPDGMARLFNGGFQAGTITLCMAGETDPRYFRQLVLSAPGRIRIQHPTGIQPICQ